jgi:hypothetical protein
MGGNPHMIAPSLMSVGQFKGDGYLTDRLHSLYVVGLEFLCLLIFFHMSNGRVKLIF